MGELVQLKMCFTETWLQEHMLDSNASKLGFKTIWSNGDNRGSGRSKGRGITVLVNNRWCNPGLGMLKEEICTEDIELLAVSLSRM